MSDELQEHVCLIQNELNRRIASNRNYSLRALARDFDIEPSALSRILSRKQQISITDAACIVRKLKMSENDARYFFESVLREKVNVLSKRFYQILTELDWTPFESTELI